jgi:superfamily II DNA or RNA helicase
MTQQILLPDPSQPSELELPPLIAGPFSTPVGQMRKVLRPAVCGKVTSISKVQLSARRSSFLYDLHTGERVVVVDASKAVRPEDADGILQRLDSGKLRWISHRETDAFAARVSSDGWAPELDRTASSWNGKLVYRAERPEADGTVLPGNEGLRPPQLGALHAIAAHWSVFRNPATIVMPTGTGKTETMLGALAGYVRKPMLVVVPSDLLRSQTAGKFLTFGLLRKLGVLADGAENPIVGVVTSRPRSVADLEIFERCNVIIGTMSSLGMGAAAPLAREIAQRIDTLVVDEAHHVAAKGWSAFKEAFFDRKILQFTATPFRRDGLLVDGQVIYNYPLRQAQQDRYFKPITFEPVYEIDQPTADRVVAAAAVEKLRSDLAAGLNHIAMARCERIERAREVFAIYDELAPDLKPMLVHSEISDTDARLSQLRRGESRIVVCVNMLGEGFDLPELKIAAIHDLHKSLAILLQFTGRFTRTSGDDIGDATVVANLADIGVSSALERLYSEDADWNHVLSELSSQAAREHAELVEFLRSSRRLHDGADDESAISHQLLRPTLSTLTYTVSEFKPERFLEGIASGVEVRAAWLNDGSNTLFFVTRYEPPIKWMRSKALRDREWSLFVLHYDSTRRLLYLSSTDHSSTFERLAQAVGGEVQLLSGDQMFRSLGHIKRLVFQNVGVKKHGRRNLRYAMYTGADVAEALSLSERAGSVKSNVSGTGWEGGRPITIGCSYKGRVWSREQGPIPRFVGWSEHIGSKLLDSSIDTKDIIANVLIPTEVTSLPGKEILGADWPIELLGQSEERVLFSKSDREEPMAMFSLNYERADVAGSKVILALVHAEDGVWARLELVIGGTVGFEVLQAGENHVHITVGKLNLPLHDYLSQYPPLVRFVDLTELDGNLLIAPQHLDQIPFPDDRLDPWDWSGVNIQHESMWKDGAKRASSIQETAAKHFLDAGYDVVFDDDAAGEAADLVCFKEEADHIRLALVHCKFSGGKTPGERVKDVVEVSSQAVRSAKWKWRFKDLCRHLVVREKSLATDDRPTRFLRGNAAQLSGYAKSSRFKDIRPEILIVQPGLKQGSVTPDQALVLGSAMAYLKETIGVDLDVICSS